RKRPRPVPGATESSCFPSWCCSWLCRFVHAGVRVEEYQRARPADSAGLDPLEGRTFNRGGSRPEQGMDSAETTKPRPGSGLCAGHPKMTVLVGATGIEPATFSSRTRRATRLRYAPCW